MFIWNELKNVKNNTFICRAMSTLSLYILFFKNILNFIIHCVPFIVICLTTGPFHCVLILFTIFLKNYWFSNFFRNHCFFFLLSLLF